MSVDQKGNDYNDIFLKKTNANVKIQQQNVSGIQKQNLVGTIQANKQFSKNRCLSPPIQKNNYFFENQNTMNNSYMIQQDYSNLNSQSPNQQKNVNFIQSQQQQQQMQQQYTEEYANTYTLNSNYPLSTSQSQQQFKPQSALSQSQPEENSQFQRQQKQEKKQEIIENINKLAKKLNSSSGKFNNNTSLLSINNPNLEDLIKKKPLQKASLAKDNFNSAVFKEQTKNDNNQDIKNSNNIINSEVSKPIEQSINRSPQRSSYLRHTQTPTNTTAATQNKLLSQQDPDISVTAHYTPQVQQIPFESSKSQQNNDDYNNKIKSFSNYNNIISQTTFASPQKRSSLHYNQNSQNVNNDFQMQTQQQQQQHQQQQQQQQQQQVPSVNEFKLRLKISDLENKLTTVSSQLENEKRQHSMNVKKGKDDLNRCQQEALQKIEKMQSEFQLQHHENQQIIQDLQDQIEQERENQIQQQEEMKYNLEQDTKQIKNIYESKISELDNVIKYYEQQLVQQQDELVQLKDIVEQQQQQLNMHQQKQQLQQQQQEDDEDQQYEEGEQIDLQENQDNLSFEETFQLEQSYQQKKNIFDNYQQQQKLNQEDLPIDEQIEYLQQQIQQKQFEKYQEQMKQAGKQYSQQRQTQQLFNRQQEEQKEEREYPLKKSISKQSLNNQKDNKSGKASVNRSFANETPKQNILKENQQQNTDNKFVDIQNKQPSHQLSPSQSENLLEQKDIIITKLHESNQFKDVEMVKMEDLINNLKELYEQKQLEKDELENILKIQQKENNQFKKIFEQNIHLFTRNKKPNEDNTQEEDNEDGTEQYNENEEQEEEEEEDEEQDDNRDQGCQNQDNEEEEEY